MAPSPLNFDEAAYDSPEIDRRRRWRTSTPIPGASPPDCDISAILADEEHSECICVAPVSSSSSDDSWETFAQWSPRTHNNNINNQKSDEESSYETWNAAGEFEQWSPFGQEEKPEAAAGAQQPIGYLWIPVSMAMRPDAYLYYPPQATPCVYVTYNPANPAEPQEVPVGHTYGFVTYNNAS